MDFAELLKSIKHTKDQDGEDITLVPTNFFMQLLEDFADTQYSKAIKGAPRVSLEELNLELIEDEKL